MRAPRAGPQLLGDPGHRRRREDRGDGDARVPDGALTRRAAPVATAAAVILFARLAWDVPTGVLVQGALVGGLSSLLALGIALVWRANRAVNFAAGDLGILPATLAVLLMISTVGLGWWPALGIGLVAAVGLGIVLETLVVRRFRRAPRLVLAVATIGLAQLLAAGALLLPRWFDLTTTPIPAPFDARIEIDPIIFRGSDVAAFIAVPLLFAALALFLRRSATGIAIRASAERADRAETLGIPVRRLQTIVWTVATVLAFVAVFLRAGIVGLPIGEVLGPAILLRALAAAVIGRMERLPTIALAAVVLGVVEQAVIWHWREPAYVDPILFVVVLGALLLTRGPVSARLREASTWQAAREVRPVPRELSSVGEVRALRWVPPVAVAALLLAVPAVLSTSEVNLAAAILIFAIVGLSLVVLTGWAGQVSLGQMAFVGIGAAVGGALTSRAGWDLSLALIGGGLVGAGVAVLIGLPALRRRGLTLAVTTLAFALATSSWLLNPAYFGPGTALDWLPEQRIDRPDLFGFVSITGETSYYYVCVAGLALAYALVRVLRASRTGRAIVATRENERAAEAFGISARATTILAFAWSGFLAAFAGVLFVHHQSGLGSGPYEPAESLEVFAMTVIGGLGSAPGALLGAVYVRGADYYLAAEWQVLATGAGLLGILLLLPGGIGAALADARDAILRLVARRRGIVVPSLVADIDPGAPAPGSGPVAPTPPQTSTGNGAFLTARGVDVAYDGVQVLFGVDLDAAEGEVVALLGTNGSGKSTFLRAVAGIAPPRRGTVTVAGRDTTRMRADRIAAFGIVSVPGGEGTFPSLTVAEHLRLAAWTRHAPERADAVEGALARLPALRDQLATPAGALSGGQQQMLTLAMAFVAGPRLLLLDELSLGLAPAIVRELLGVVRELADGGTTIVLVEQSVDVALSVAGRAYFLEKGTVRFEGPTAELLERPDLVRSVFLERAASGDRVAPGAPEASSPATDVGLEVHGLVKSFGGIRALDDVSFEVRGGEVLGIIGPNGAGKTTLFDVVGGFEPSDAGRVVLRTGDRTDDVSRLPPAARARRGLGRSFQDARLFPALTVSESIAVALDHGATPARVDELVELLGLTAFRDKFVRELSTGTRRVVDLACEVAHAPRVLLLDEPSTGIAQSEAEALAPVLLRVRDELGAALVVIEHDLTLVRAIATRLLALDLGAVVAQGEPEAVLRDDRVVAAYLGS